MSHPRVLVVDDQPGAAYLLATMANACDCDVRIAVGGREAVQIAREWRPQVVLLDLMMPEMDGFEVAARLRQSQSDTKIVAVTALPRNDLRVREAEFDRYLAKPVLKETVGQVIRQLAS